MRKAAIFLMMLIALSANYAFAQKPAVVTENEPGWTKIGEITASFKMQNESIVVLGADEFDAIKLKVTDAPINIERLQVFYESGDMEEIDVRSELQAGSETRTINLEQPNRDIQKVAFTYKTLPNFQGEKAHVELHGLKTRRHDDREDKDGKDRNDYRDREDNDVEEAAEDAERDAEKTAEEVEEDAEEAADKVEEETDEARDEVKEESKEVEKDIDRETTTINDDIAESAAILESEITDKTYKGKVGPDGQTIYIDNQAKTYYINAKGNKVYITKAQMKDKPKKDN